MKTAVLMATYNGEKFLENQLDSVRNQELKPDFVVFRDDCSTDGTIAFLKQYIARYNLENWLIRENETNLGWRLNFRQLLIDSQELDVDLVFFSDQDDTWKLDKNRRQVEVLKEHPEIEVLSGDIEIKKISEQATIPTYFEFSDHYAQISKYPAKTTYNSFRSGWTLAIRRSLVDAALKYWKPEYNITHDVLFATLSSLTETGYNLNQTVGIHLRHAGNASGKALLTIHDPKALHVSELYKFVGFYDIIYKILKDRESDYAPEIKNYYEFYVKRHHLASENKIIPVFAQIFTEWKYYAGMSGRIRDVIFAFKK
ncbi:glycosyltransferase [Lactococcus fujiensis]|nr:glycosyltransferase [Lactococcus fujiensis]